MSTVTSNYAKTCTESRSEVTARDTASPRNTVTLRDLVAKIYEHGLPGNLHSVLAAVQIGELNPVAYRPMAFVEHEANAYLHRLAEDASW